MVAVKNRITLRQRPAAELRLPEPTPPGAIPGRLGRPRMVELYRSLGSGTLPTLSVADRYVDPTFGNDAADGLTRQTAWRTMGHAADSTQGLGLGIGYLSGNLQGVDLHNNRGAGANFLDRVNTHYVLEGEETTIHQDFSNRPAIWIKGNRYLQFSGFDILNTSNGPDGIDWTMATHSDDFEHTGKTHHLIFADMTGEGFGQIFGGEGGTFIRLLSCEMYDGAFWHDGGGSNSTYVRLAAVPNNGDMTPVAYIDGKGLDLWVERCYSGGARQKTDSSALSTGAGKTYDGNSYMADYTKSYERTVRAAWVNNVSVNTGGKGFNSYEGGMELWYINDLSAYSGRHIQFVEDSNDPVYEMDPAGQGEFVTQTYSSDDGPDVTTHWWNCVAICGDWLRPSDRAYIAWQGEGDNKHTIDSQNCVRYNAPGADSYSTEITGHLGLVDDSLDYRVFDPRLVEGSQLLTGGDNSLLARAGVTTDFAGNPIDLESPGHLGPYSQPVGAP